MSKPGPSRGAETDWKVRQNDSVRSAVSSLLEELLIRGRTWKPAPLKKGGWILGRRGNDAPSRVRARGRLGKKTIMREPERKWCRVSWPHPVDSLSLCTALALTLFPFKRWVLAVSPGDPGPAMTHYGMLRRRPTAILLCVMIISPMEAANSITLSQKNAFTISVARRLQIVPQRQQHRQHPLVCVRTCDRSGAPTVVFQSSCE